MAKKAKPQKKPPQAQGPKPAKAVFSYHAEPVPTLARLNELGGMGWELLFFSDHDNMAYFIGDSKAKMPEMPEQHQHEEQPQS